MNHYELLNVAPTATVEEIEKAFRQLSVKYHPDRDKTPIGAAIFRQLGEAHKTLTDPAKRADYDARLNAGPTPTPQPQNNPSESKVKEVIVDVAIAAIPLAAEAISGLLQKYKRKK